jgi:3'-phosphoadenosine 5'-phosphosulfate sulfotransferase (PAPS reductase)/FAD synthetase
VNQRKQTLREQDDWGKLRARARAEWPDDKLDNLIDRTVEQIKDSVGGRRAAYAWSGGKDSIALGHVAELAGIHDCVLGISNLEFPAFLQWVTDHMPDGLTVVNTSQDLRWLAKNPNMLFPQGAWGPKWFTAINHRSQARYYRDEKLDVLLLGRRHSDGNYTGPAGATEYTNAQGITRSSPIAHWSHTAVFALIDRENLPMPPCYDWPRGYQVGTGSWPARQWTNSIDHGFEEVWAIDPDVVRQAAPVLPQAADWMARTGHA